MEQKKFNITESAYVLTNANPGENLLFVMAPTVLDKKVVPTPIVRVTRMPVVRTIINWFDECECRKSTHTFIDVEGNTWFVGFPKREDADDYLFMPACEKAGVVFNEIGKGAMVPLCRDNLKDFIGKPMFYFSDQYVANGPVEGVALITSVDMEDEHPITCDEEYSVNTLKFAFINNNGLVCLGDSDRTVYVMKL